MITFSISILFLALIILKYVFDMKIHDKYIYIVLALLLLKMNATSKYSAIEMFDGSSIAFDKEAFENLNRVVNEIAGQGKLTIPGNLIVQGTATFDKDVTMQKKLTVNEDVTMKKKLTVKDIATFDKDTKINGHLFIKNQKLEGSSSYGIIANKLLANEYICQGGRYKLKKEGLWAPSMHATTVNATTVNAPTVKVNTIGKLDGTELKILDYCRFNGDLKGYKDNAEQWRIQRDGKMYLKQRLKVRNLICEHFGRTHDGEHKWKYFVDGNNDKMKDDDGNIEGFKE